VGDFRGVELTNLVLTTQRLILRPWRRDDVPRLVEIMAGDTMHEFLALPQPYTAAAAEQFVAEIAAQPLDAGTGFSCALTERAGGGVVGSALLRLGTEPEIGYWVAPDSQGHGYATEATAALAAWAFEHGVTRVALLCEVRNVASAAVALAAGFRFEGVSRGGFVGGGYADVPERRGDLARFARLAGDPPGRIAPAFPRLGGDDLSDGVIALRPERPDDADALFECEDELTVRWNFTGAAKSYEDLVAATRRAGLDWLVGPAAQFGLVDVASGRVAGGLQLRKAGPPQVGGIGYVVHPAFRGRGYTSRALRLLAGWAFDVADFARLELGAKVGNVASWRTAESAGWQPEGIRQTRLRNGDGSFGDERRYVLLNPRYAGSSPARRARRPRPA
jgi:RimJ/RimL family protein N-acetyltransferase